MIKHILNRIASVDKNCLVLFFLGSFSIIPGLNLIYFLIDKDPAPGPTGGLQPQGKDLTQALVRPRPPRGARSAVALDLLHLVIAKKDDRDHGHPKGLGLCRIRMGVFQCVIILIFFLLEGQRFTRKQLNSDIRSSFLTSPILFLLKPLLFVLLVFVWLSPPSVQLPPARSMLHRNTWVTILAVCETVNVDFIKLLS